MNRTAEPGGWPARLSMTHWPSGRTRETRAARACASAPELELDDESWYKRVMAANPCGLRRAAEAQRLLDGWDRVDHALARKPLSQGEMV